MESQSFRVLLESAPDSIILADRQGRIKLVNRRTEELFAYSRDELLGENVELLVPERLRRVHLQHRDTYANDPRTREMGADLELYGRRKDGSEFPVEISLSPAPVDTQGEMSVIAFVRDVTDRRAAETRFRALLESAPDAIVLVDPDGRVALANRRVEEIFGYGGDELLGERVEVLVPERLRSRHLGHRAGFARDPRTREMGAGLELYGQRKDGSEFPVEISLSPMEHGGRTLVTTIIRDVSERRAAERERLDHARAQAARDEAEAARRHLAAILNDIDAIVWEAADAERHRFQFVTGRAEEMLGYPLGRWQEPGFWQQVIHPDDREPTVAFFRENAETGLRHQLEYRLVSASGGVVWVRDLAHAVREGASERRFRGVIIDLTERRELEGRLLQSQKLEAVGQLAGGVAHDFNNLLTVISGYAALAAAREPNGEPGIELREIQGAAERASQLTQQLLSFSRRSPRSDELVNLSELVGRVESMLRRLIDEDIRLTTRTEERLPRVRGDSAQLEQVLVNLVVNARDAIPAGGEIRIVAQSLELGSAVASELELDPGPYVGLTVSDTGEGMPPEVSARVFEPFFTTKPPGQGSGLGLASAYGIVEQAGGRITVSSVQGEGSDFMIYLPVAARAEDEDAGDRLPPARGGPTILLVEDERSLRQLAVRVLEDADYHVIAATDGRHALEEAERHAGRIDLLLTDVVMPGASGLELAERLNQLRPDLKVLYMSGYADSRLARSGATEADLHILRKPFNPKQLIQRVSEALRADEGAPAYRSRQR